VLVLVGGTLLVTPGFLSDVVGVLCLLPPTRALLRPVLTRFVARRLGLTGVGSGFGSRGATPHRRTFREAEVLDGEVIDGEVIDPPASERPPPDGRRP
jgi:UPF0716 protein FxsA